ncbi:conserved hypothetical protein [Culex quinquefasciatus]|uniref:Uncharacterized protein n=1 Tax=Culex quinquefasciatus TaxID=7176 RepID=B0X7P4_CULQU|nr:conserved hypothetical protein [Culex quinquefasciatus]|eukprot:XP_001865666.1 conserved hypothetical protein [Culex quinquefasciatus]
MSASASVEQTRAEKIGANVSAGKRELARAALLLTNERKQIAGTGDIVVNVVASHTSWTGFDSRRSRRHFSRRDLSVRILGAGPTFLARFYHAKKMEADSPRIKSTLVSTGSTASLVASNRCRADRLLVADPCNEQCLKQKQQKIKPRRIGSMFGFDMTGKFPKKANRFRFRLGACRCIDRAWGRGSSGHSTVLDIAEKGAWLEGDWFVKFEIFNLQIFKSSNLQIFKSSNLQIFKSSNLQIFKSSNLQIFKSSNLQIFKSSNLQIFKSSNLQIFKSSNLQIFKSSNLQIFKSSNIQIFKSSNLQIFKSSNLQIFKSSNHQTATAAKERVAEKYGNAL